MVSWFSVAAANTTHNLTQGVQGRPAVGRPSFFITENRIFLCPSSDTFALSEGRGAVPSEIMRESVPSKVTAKCRHSAPAYAHKQVLAALQSNDDYTQYRREHGERAARSAILGQAISYRFKRDAEGCRLFVSIRMMDVPLVADRRRGAIGVDLNADHPAVAETDS